MVTRLFTTLPSDRGTSGTDRRPARFVRPLEFMRFDRRSDRPRSAPDHRRLVEINRRAHRPGHGRWRASALAARQVPAIFVTRSARIQTGCGCGRGSAPSARPWGTPHLQIFPDGQRLEHLPSLRDVRDAQMRPDAPKANSHPKRDRTGHGGTTPLIVLNRVIFRPRSAREGDEPLGDREGRRSGRETAVGHREVFTSSTRRVDPRHSGGPATLSR